MRLEDFYKWPEMVIAEAPIIGPDQLPMKDSSKFGLKDPSIIDRLTPTNQTIEGNELFALKQGDNIIFQLRNNGQTLTTLAGQLISNFPGPKRRGTVAVNRTETPPELQGEGYSTSMIDGLANLGYRIISDFQVSPAAQRVWDKLEAVRKDDIKFWNIKTKTFTKEHPKGKGHIHYVLEHCTFKQQSSIVGDSQFWTHPDIESILEEHYF